MGVRYLENRCVLEPPPVEPLCRPEIPFATLVDKPIPIPEDSSFSMIRLAENPKILALEFQDPEAMKSTLGRIATWVEVLGRKKIPTLKESVDASGYDLRLEDVADFINACTEERVKFINSCTEDERVKLTPGENALMVQLILQGLLTPMEKGLLTYLQPEYQASSPYALIAVDPELEAADPELKELRKEVWIHEYSHALYFLDEGGFRSQVSKAFASLAPKERRFLSSTLIASWYKSGAPWLIETEIQAYAIGRQGGRGLEFFKLIQEAEKNCRHSLELTCEDFRSYPKHQRKGLIARLHEKYVRISKDRIPFLNSSNKKEGGYLARHQKHSKR